MKDQIQFGVDKKTETTANVFFKLLSNSSIKSSSGKLTGPYCSTSKTLPSEFAVQATKVKNLSASMIVDPCYWTPALPFLYKLQLVLQMQDGREVEQTAQIGLRRWDCQDSNFQLENRRVVIRGGACDQLTEESIEQARLAETALIIDRFDQDFIECVDRLGGMLVLDLRNVGDSLNDLIDQLNWSPSVFLALFSSEQKIHSNADSQMLRHCHLAQCLTTSSTADDLVDLNENSPLKLNSEAIAVELQPGEVPPAWLARINRPIVVVRRGVEYANFVAARTACDQLQAELAPDFNLAGYFVAP